MRRQWCFSIPGPAIRAVLALLCALALLLPLPPAPVAAQAGDRPRYEIEATIDIDTGAVDVHQVVTYPNATGDTLSSIVFHITAAYYGAFALDAVAVDDTPVEATLDGIVLTVPLPEPLPPGETAEVALDFGLTVPQPGNLRFGFSQGILALGNWYPVLSVYRQGAFTYGGELPAGWDKHQQGTPSQLAQGVEAGDPFFTDLADYEVSLTLSRPVTVAHTGVRVDDGDELGQMRLRALAVRDFALALSDRYEIDSVQVGGTTITAFYLPEHAAGGAQYLRSAAESLAWFNETLGAYPYATLHVAETASNDSAWVGQEYPQVIFISSQITDGPVGIGSYLNYLVVHEVLHQWFYGLIGNDQLYEPWVDEALVTHLSYRFLEAQDADLGRATWQNLHDQRRQEAAIWPDRPVNTSIYDYGNEAHYFAMIYRKGAAFLEEVRQAMGDQAYLAALRDYATTYRGSFATGRDVLATLEAAGGPSLREIFAKYFTYPEYRTPPTATVAPTASPTVAGTGTAVATPSPVTTGTATPAAGTPASTPTPPSTATRSGTVSPTPSVTVAPTASSTPEASPTATAEPTPPPATGLLGLPPGSEGTLALILGLVAVGALSLYAVRARRAG